MEALPQSGFCPACQGGLDGCPEAVLLADGQGRLFYANQAARTLLGYGSENLSERSLQQALPELPRLQTDGGGRKQTVCQHRDGRRLRVEVFLHQPVVEGRRLQVAFLREISAGQRLEEQLREARKMEAVGRLVAGVSHDFNNLLTAILIYTGLLLNQLPEESPLRLQAEQLNLAAERGRSLVGQLMVLGGRRPAELALLSLNQVIESVRDMLTRMLGEHVSLETRYGERLRAVWADRTQMEEMLVNLAINARDAMPDGGLLRIATANFTADEGAARRYPGMTPGHYVRLTVSDTGYGMDEETRAHAFEPFFTTKPSGRGTGLGLSTVHEIVRQSQGQLILESAPERGTQVKVFLPAVAGEPTKPSAPSREVKAVGAGTVLVVEDDELVRRSLHDILNGRGYGVLQARNAREAILIGRSYAGAIDLMLTDMVLPGMGGPELAETLRPVRPEMPVLYISGYRDDARLRLLQQAGKAFFPKPFTAAAIAEKVSEILAAAPRKPGQSAVTPVTAEAMKGR